MTDTPQHMTALQLANRVRKARAELRNEIHALPEDEGRARLAEMLADPPGFMHRVLVKEALDWPLRVGPYRVAQMMRRAGVAEVKTIGAASERQRRDLGRCLLGLGKLVAAEAEERLERARVEGRAA